MHACRRPVRSPRAAHHELVAFRHPPPLCRPLARLTPWGPPLCTCDCCEAAQGHSAYSPIAPRTPRLARAIYNAVPPVLFFVFALGSTRTLQITAFWMQVRRAAVWAAPGEGYAQWRPGLGEGGGVCLHLPPVGRQQRGRRHGPVHTLGLGQISPKGDKSKLACMQVAKHRGQHVALCLLNMVAEFPHGERPRRSLLKWRWALQRSCACSSSSPHPAPTLRLDSTSLCA